MRMGTFQKVKWDLIQCFFCFFLSAALFKVVSRAFPSCAMEPVKESPSVFLNKAVAAINTKLSEKLHTATMENDLLWVRIRMQERRYILSNADIAVSCSGDGDDMMRQEVRWLLKERMDATELKARIRDLVSSPDAPTLIEQVKLHWENKEKEVVTWRRAEDAQPAVEQLQNNTVSVPVYVELFDKCKGLQAELDSVRDVSNAVAAEQEAYWMSLHLYWRREFVFLNRLANQTVELDMYRALMASLLVGVPQDMLEAKRLQCKVEALERSLQSEFVPRMVEYRTATMSDALSEFRDCNILSKRKNATIRALGSEVAMLQRALGQPGGVAVNTAMCTDVEKDLMRLDGLRRLANDEMQVECRNHSSKMAAYNAAVNELKSIGRHAIEARTQLARMQGECVQAESQRDRVFRALDAARAELAGLQRDIEACRNGLFAGQIKIHEKEVFKLKEQRDFMSKAVESLKREHVEIEESIREARVEFVRVEQKTRLDAKTSEKPPDHDGMTLVGRSGTVAIGDRMIQTSIRRVGEQTFVTCHECGQSVVVDAFREHCKATHKFAVFGCERLCGHCGKADHDWATHHQSVQCKASAFVVVSFAMERMQL